MENTSIIALSRQGALNREIGIIANNLANMNSTGFKARKMMFVEHLVRSKGGDGKFGDRLSFVRDIATVRDTSQGALDKTGNPLDMALRGDGYFVVETKDGERYTRNGHFHLDTEGQLVTANGQAVLSEGGQPLFFGPEDTKITVSRDGTVSTVNGELGKLRIVRFENDKKLREEGEGLFVTDQAPVAVAEPDVVQNALESSNVRPITEMARMIAAQRSYDGVRRFINREDQRIRTMMRELTRAA
jgi:flagellar basal-body rod protein FlgF